MRVSKLNRYDRKQASFGPTADVGAMHNGFANTTGLLMAQLGSPNDARKEGRERGKRKLVFLIVGEHEGMTWKGFSRFSQVENSKGGVRPSTTEQLFSTYAVQVSTPVLV